MTRPILITVSVLVLIFPALLAVTIEVEGLLGLAPKDLDRLWRVVITLVVIGVLVLILALRARGGYGATLQGTALWVPWTAALASSALYLASDPGPSVAATAGDRGAHALLIGGGLAGALWLLYAVADHEYPTARRQSPGWYGLLKDAITLLKLGAAGASAVYPDPKDPNKATIEQITIHLTAVDKSLEVPGLEWVTRDGFTVAWTAYHSADEAMIGVTTTADVIDAAISDLLRLDGADIKSRAALQTDLLTAVIELDPKIKPYVTVIVPKDVTPATEDECPPKPANPVTLLLSAIWARVKEILRALIDKFKAPPAIPATPEEAQAAAVAAAAEALASAREAERRPRIVIQTIHHALNTYRGSRWGELGRARWQLMLTTTVAGIVAFLVLALALIRGVDTQQLEAGWAYFLVGAVAGLFLRLRLASEEYQVTDDYGLEAARVYQTPLLSGMAAVIGVVLMASVAGSQLGNVVNPIREPMGAAVATASPGPSASGTSASPSSESSPSASQEASTTPSTQPQSTEATLSKAFNIGGYPLGIVLAIAFGLTPNLVLRRLGISASNAKKDLVATRPT